MDFRLYIWPRYVLEWAGHTITLSNSEGAVMSQIVGGHRVTYPEIIDSLYGHREDGGPLDAHNAACVAICRIRKKLVGSPFRIPTREYGYVRLIINIPEILDRIADEVLDTDT